VALVSPDFKKRLRTTSRSKRSGDDLSAASMETMQQQMVVFQRNLEEFAIKHRKAINKNPEFRKHFQTMCVNIGVDPLASNKGFWAELLGVGDFYYQLGVQIIEAGLRTRAANGGLMEITDLAAYVVKLRGKKAQAVSVDDIELAVKKLEVLGGGTRIIRVGASRRLVQLVPIELDTDHSAVLAAAQERGYVTQSALAKQLGWNDMRVLKVLQPFLREGIVWIDDQADGERQYWFPSLAGAL
jgi:ESCRT-II complex subunit VPS22